MAVEIRPAGDDWETLKRVDQLAFGVTVPEPDLELTRGILELDRALLAHVDGAPAGCTAAYSLALSVPGGLTVPTAGVTWVGVLPTHRRRGVLTAMLRHQLADLRERGREPLAVLWASEPSIYPRFGYGLATRRVAVVAPRSTPPLFRAPSVDGLALEILEPSDDEPLTAPVYERLLGRRGGVPVRDARWHRWLVHDPADDRAGASALRTLVVRRDQQVRGYARFRTRQDWSGDFADGTTKVQELVADDAPAAAALWGMLLDVDLMGRTEAWNLPVDDPLLSWLADPRRAHPTTHDALYLRLVDVPAALASRRYGADLDLVLDVRDEHAPWNHGRWRLTVRDGAAECSSTSGEPDLGVDVSDLGAVFLGGARSVALAGAGWVVEHTAGAARRLDAAFAVDHQPWCPHTF